MANTITSNCKVSDLPEGCAVIVSFGRMMYRGRVVRSNDEVLVLDRSNHLNQIPSDAVVECEELTDSEFREKMQTFLIAQEISDYIGDLKTAELRIIQNWARTEQGMSEVWKKGIINVCAKKIAQSRPLKSLPKASLTAKVRRLLKGLVSMYKTR